MWYLPLSNDPMGNRCLVFPLLCCASLGLRSQYWPNHLWDNWYFGLGGGLTFESGGCQPLSGNPNAVSLSAHSSTASAMNDGTIELVANGKLWSGTGHELLGEQAYSNFVNQQLVIGRPEAPGRWYWLVEANDTLQFTGTYLTAVEIDATANSGDGAFQSPFMDLGIDLGSRMTAIPSATNDTIWLLVDSPPDSLFYSFPVTNSGIGLPQAAGSAPLPEVWPRRPLKAARQGDKVACAAGYADISLFKFDRTFGTVTAPVTVAFDGGLYDLEFSPDGKLLFAISGLQIGGGNHIWQYDLSVWDSVAIADSRIAIEADSTLYTSALQLAPDDRIYTWTGDDDSTKLSVIGSPNESGLACAHQLYSVPLPPGVTLADVHENRPEIWWPSALPNVGVATYASVPKRLRVWPDPAVDQVHLGLPAMMNAGGQLQITLAASDGRIVENRQAAFSDEIILQRQGWCAGVYQVVVKDRSGHSFSARVLLR